jgi:uncharacterized membrane protein
MIQIFLITAIVSIIDSIYLFLTQKFLAGIYQKAQPATDSYINLLYIFICWFFIALAIYFLIVSRSDFDFLTILKTAPVLGAAIFGIYTLGNYISNPEKWSFTMVGIDIVRGIIIVSLSTIIFSFFRKTFK